VESFSFTDLHHLRAAEGWLELGSHLDAIEELEKITPSLRSDPDVLKLRWHIYAKAKQWDGALETAGALCKRVPNQPTGWIWRANSLYFLKRTQEAHDLIRAKLADFPDQWVMHYDLACYACQLGRKQEAFHWLNTAMALGDEKKVKRIAHEDPDLEPLWATA
jgi:predicted Zn-dependent protease